MAELVLNNGSAPSPPSAGKTSIYADTSGQVHILTGTSDINILDVIKTLTPIVVGATTDCAIGNGKFYFTIPLEMDGWNLHLPHAKAIAAGTTGTMDIQIRNVTKAQDMLSTKLTIDSGDLGSNDATTPAVVDTTKDDVSAYDTISVDIDAVHTTPAKGLIMTIPFGS
jgi:hypothetical protein